MKKVIQILWCCPICDFVSTREVKECPACANNQAYSLINVAAVAAQVKDLMFPEAGE